MSPSIMSEDKSEGGIWERKWGESVWIQHCVLSIRVKVIFTKN